MRDLIDFAERDDVKNLLKQVFAEAKPEAGHQGVWVGRHPLWERMWAHDSLSNTPLPWHWDSIWPDIELGSAVPDPVWRGDEWLRLLRHWQFPHPDRVPPFLLHFRFRPSSLKDPYERQRILRLATRANLLAVVEERPVASAFSGGARAPAGLSPSLSSGALIRANGIEGTLGGFVLDRGRTLGVTCAHVAPKGATVEAWLGGKWQTIGTCVDASSFTPMPQCGVNCYLDTSATPVDIALIDVHAATPAKGFPGVGVLIDFIAPMDIPRNVVVLGAKTGNLSFNVTKFGIWQEVMLPSGQCVCFKDMFELNPPASGYVAKPLSLLWAGATKAGDSGAWVVGQARSGPMGAAGMIAAGDGISSYATLFECAKNWASSLGRVLRL